MSSNHKHQMLHDLEPNTPHSSYRAIACLRGFTELRGLR